MKPEKRLFFRRGLNCLAALCCSLLFLGSVFLITERQQDTVSAYASEEDGVDDFVSRLYTVILERNPDEAGLAEWSGYLQDGTFTGAEVAKGFIMSDEFLNKEMTNEEFVQILYSAFFGREADASGLATWTGFLDDGYRKSYVFAGFANSDEFGALCEGYGVEAGSVPVTISEQQPNLSEEDYNVWLFVERMYTEVLNRPADMGGISEWAGYLQDGTFTGAEVASGFILSEEFQAKEMSNEEYVKIMYRAFFGREADPSGLETWVNALETSFTKEYVFAGFANSNEFDVLCGSYGITRGEVEIPEQEPQATIGWLYYDQLESYEKKVYDLLLEADGEITEFMIYDSELPEGMTKDNLFSSVNDRARYALLLDYPFTELDYSWAFVDYIEDESGYKITVKDYEIPEYHMEKMMAIINQWAGVANESDDRYTKIRKLYEVIADNIEYEYSLLGGSSWAGASYGNTMGVLHGYLVCSGYSAVVKEICDMWEIPCARISNGAHAWNMIQMEDGSWYLLDTTSITPESWENHHTLEGLSSLEGNPEYIWSDMGVELGYFLYPELAEEDYVYTGTNTDFSYTLPELDFEEGEPKFVYKVNEDGETCTIVTYQGKQEGDLVIPEEMDGYTVTVIGDAAFVGCDGFDGNLVIPDTVTRIGEFAFYACDNLTGTIELPEQLGHLGDAAFLRCHGFTGDISFPDSISYIGPYAFAYCQGLDGNLYYPDNWEKCYIGENAFSHCENFNGMIYLPDNFVFDEEAFLNTNFSGISVSENSQYYTLLDGVIYNKEMTELVYCPANKEGILTIPEGVVKILDKAAAGCEKLTGIVFPESLEYIGEQAFLYALNIASLDIPDSVTYIGESAFSSAVNGSLHIPNQLTEIKSFTFFGVSEEPVIVPNSVTKLGQWALGGSFEYIVLSDNITEMDTEAVIQNGELGIIYYNEANAVIAAMAAANPQYDWVSYSDRDALLEMLEEQKRYFE